MSLIGPWVDRNSLGAEAFQIGCGFKQIWHIAASCISECRDFIDVYA
jgi:hypothetical protein